MELVKDLPEVFQEFAEQRQNSFIAVKEVKDKNIPVIGSFCTYFPQEIAMAMGAITVSLCSTSDETIPVAERDLPRNLCPLIKASYGFALTNKCPYFYFSDVIVGETTCDGKKKMYELMGQFKETYLLELPNSQREAGLKLWKSEIIKFKEYLEKHFGVKITEEQIKKSISVNNEIRREMRKFYELMRNDPAPITGLELYQVLYGSTFKLKREEIAEEISALSAKIQKEYNEGKMLESGLKRILITGCPIGGATLKIVNAIEENGGVAVCFENCGGAKKLDRMVDENQEDIYQALAERYLGIACSVMTPNNNRLDLLERLIKEYKVDGVVEMVLTACHTYAVETNTIKKTVNGMGIPYIAVETDYSQSDIGQLNTRLSAFIEML